MTERAAFLVVLVAGSLGMACNRTAPAASASTEMSRAVVDPYVKVAEALASDSIDGIRANAGDIATAAARLGALAFKIDTAALQLASADDLDDARAKFGVLSEAIDAYMAGQHLTPPDGIRVAFCPMVLKSWLQPDGELRNPYHGSQMLTCGSFRN
jgi:hypothetical protein